MRRSTGWSTSTSTCTCSYRRSRRAATRRESLRDAARIEAGLRGFLETGGFKAFTDTFEDLDGLPQLPGIAVQRLMADGYGFGGEGDWKTAALVRIAKVMSAGLDRRHVVHGGLHVPPRAGRAEGARRAHAGGVPLDRVAGQKPSCEIHPLSIGGKQDPVRLVFTAAPGPAVVVSLIDLGDRFRLVANEVDVVSPDEDLPRLPVARAVWEPKPDLATAAEAWLLAGGAHHTSFCQSLDMEVFTDLAEIAGLELLAIDAETRMRDFKNELRWNQAYFHLARGL